MKRLGLIVPEFLCVCDFWGDIITISFAVVFTLPACSQLTVVVMVAVAVVVATIAVVVEHIAATYSLLLIIVFVMPSSLFAFCFFVVVSFIYMPVFPYPYNDFPLRVKSFRYMHPLKHFQV